jgi:catechol 2,3-dioxygenase-like lactoylglutathione lyase family enzyme
MRYDPPMEGHLRVARATDHLDEVVRFYREGLGFAVVGEFHDHEGFDGVMLGHTGAGYHLEFTRERSATAGRAPGLENLLVFYLPDVERWLAATERLEAQGHAPVPSHNPYWDRQGKTYEDPDGYRVVLYQGAWVSERDRWVEQLVTEARNRVIGP